MLNPKSLSLVKTSLGKLHPRTAMRNPVMFVVWVSTLITAAFTLTSLVTGQDFGFQLATTLILFATLCFSNYSESVAEEQGKGQAQSLKKSRTALKARLMRNNEETFVDASTVKKNDMVTVKEGEVIPVDGEIVEGVATVNESAVTGESAAVLREAGGDRSGVIGGTTLLSGNLVVRVTSEPGATFLDRMIALVEGASRQKTPNEIALTILLAALTLVFLLVVVTLPPMAGFLGVSLDMVMLIALLVCLIPTTIGGLLPAIGIAGMNRAFKANIIAKSGKAVEVAGDIDVLLLDKTGTITYGDRQATEFLPVGKATTQELVDACVLTSLQDSTAEGKSIVKLAHESGFEKPVLHGDYEIIAFSAETRLSGIQLSDQEISVKGARDAIVNWAKARDLEIPKELDSVTDSVAKQGATPLVVANQSKVLGVIALSDVIKPDIKERFTKLRSLGVKTVMVTGDNPVTAGVIAAKAGVDDFIAEAKPEDKLALIKDYQAQGQLVAMVGDGTNDAPALAQADIGLAMNSGTQAAKEAGNMVDLDSDPAKLISVVEIGKQLLVTRGSLTTFSLANDVAKYFAIIPAVFAGALPVVAGLDFMNLHSPTSAVLSALLFNALIIPVLIPLATRGVKMGNVNAETLLRNNMLMFGLGGLVVPFVAIKFIDMILATIV